MARIAINNLSVPTESQSFLTELNDTDLAMDQINGGFFFLLALAAKRRRKKKPAKTHPITSVNTFTIPSNVRDILNSFFNN